MSFTYLSNEGKNMLLKERKSETRSNVYIIVAKNLKDHCNLNAYLHVTGVCCKMSWSEIDASTMVYRTCPIERQPIMVSTNQPKNVIIKIHAILTKHAGGKCEVYNYHVQNFN